MTPLEYSKLTTYRNALGQMTSEEALTIAIETDDIVRHMQPGDIAFPRFSKDAKHYLDYAELLEKEQNLPQFKEAP